MFHALNLIRDILILIVIIKMSINTQSHLIVFHTWTQLEFDMIV